MPENKESRPTHFHLLEPRLLFDAALPLVVDQASTVDSDVITPSEPLTSAADMSADDVLLQQEHEQHQEVLFINDSVTNYHSIIAQIRRDVLVVVLDQQGSGLDRVAETLERLPELDAIHLLTHGRSGQFHLGNDLINSQILAEHPEIFVEWASHLKPSGDVLLYGCDIAQDNVGQAFVHQLSELLQADIAASKDATGQDSDWNLEFVVGEVETDSLMNNASSSRYEHQLSAADDIYIRRYVDLTENDQAIELTNQTGTSVDLANYELRIYQDGNQEISLTVPLVGVLNHNQQVVISNQGASVVGITASSDISASLGINGRDAIILFNQINGAVVDSIGQIGSNDQYAVGPVMYERIDAPTLDLNPHNAYQISDQFHSGDISEPTNLGLGEAILPNDFIALEDGSQFELMLAPYFDPRLEAPIHYKVMNAFNNPLNPHVMDGVLYIQPNTHFGGTHSVTLQVTDAREQRETHEIQYTLIPTADAPTIMLENKVVYGVENDGTVPLGDIRVVIVDDDGSEMLHNVQIKVPNGWGLNKGALIAEHTYQLLPSDLNGLSVNIPQGVADVGDSAAGSVQIQAITLEQENQDIAVSSARILVSIAQQAAQPSVETQVEDVGEFVRPATERFNPALSVKLGDDDGSEVFDQLLISDIPSNIAVYYDDVLQSPTDGKLSYSHHQ